MPFKSPFTFLMLSVLGGPALTSRPTDPTVNVPVSAAASGSPYRRVVSDGVGGVVVGSPDFRGVPNNDVTAPRALASGAAGPAVPAGSAFATTTSACSFTDVGAGLTGVYVSSVAWGDYDNDGDLDILLTGYNGATPVSKLYRNSGGVNPTFSDGSAALTGVRNSSVEWGDYDNDGDLDILLTGQDVNGAAVSKLYRNSGGANPAFSEVGAGLTGVYASSVAWGDYDNDGDLDILLTGFTGAARIATLYRNSGGANPTFSDVGAGLPGVAGSSVAWGDYDNDGDLDILLTGFDGTAMISKLYRNSGGANPTFSDVGAGLTGLQQSSVAWADYDNDGDLDILLTGADVSFVPIAKLYGSSGGANPTFSDVSTGLTGVDNSSVAWGDYDKDGDVDILLTGRDVSLAPISKLYRNDSCVPNTPPTAPSGLTTTIDPLGVTFVWNAASDAQTPAAALTYNLRVGTTPGGNELSAAMAAANGYRRVVRLGNAQEHLSWTLRLPPATYYWSVQAVDGVFSGSAFATEKTCAPSFTDFATGLVGVQQSSVAWGDYDNDGDLDFLLTGSDALLRNITMLYRNSGGSNPTFSDISAGLEGVSESSVTWGDYDNDGDLDILLTGLYFGSLDIAKLYRNSGGVNPTFSDVSAGLTGVQQSSVAWGDYDNDGDLDILLTGFDGTTMISKLYRNSGGVNPTFSDVGAGLPGVQQSSVAWGDYDNDGDLDILLTGYNGTTPVSKLYRNSGGANPTFSDVDAGLPGVAGSSVAWGDYDNDGDLDILLTGQNAGGSRISKLYRNSGGVNPTFSDVGAGLPGVAGSSVAWGDYDNDGYLDILLTGANTGLLPVSRLYRNSGGANPTFSEVIFGLTEVSNSSVAWGDYDNDGDLDILLTGTSGGGNISKLYRNYSCVPNTPPSAPTGLVATLGPSGMTFNWNAASDAQTPPAALTYNLRVGTTPGGNEIAAAMAAANGYRRVVRLGNANHRLQWTLAVPPAPYYYWSVQAMDGAFAGSPFAGQYTVGVPGGAEIPTAFALGTNHPNPFPRATRIGFDLPREAAVSVRVYDMSGRLVRTLTEGRTLPAGRQEVEWDGRSERGVPVRDGVYIYAIEADGFRSSRLMVLLR